MSAHASDFIPIRLGTLRAGRTLDFDTFLAIDQRHILFLRAGETVGTDRLTALRSHGVKRLFIPLRENGAYLRYLERGLEDLNDASMPIHERGGLAADVLCTDADNSIRNFSVATSFAAARERLKKALNFLLESDGALRGILDATGPAHDIGRHCSHVSTLAMGLGRAMGIRDTTPLFQLGLAGMIHDAGQREELFDPKTPHDDLAKTARAEYEEHVPKTLVLLQGKPYIDAAIGDLVAKHEEMGLGAGYPDRLCLKDLPLLNQIFNLANQYDREATRLGLSSGDPKALTFFSSRFADLFSPALLTGLREALQFPRDST